MTRYFVALVLAGVACFAGERCRAQGQKAKATFEGHRGRVFSVAVSADGSLVASGSEDKTVKVWDVKAGKEKYTLKGHRESVTCVAFSPDGKWLASGSDDLMVRLWDMETGQLKESLK